MALNAEVLTSYKQIDEAYIDELLKKEIEKNSGSHPEPHLCGWAAVRVCWHPPDDRLHLFR